MKTIIIISLGIAIGCSPLRDTKLVAILIKITGG